VNAPQCYVYVYIACLVELLGSQHVEVHAFLLLKRGAQNVVHYVPNLYGTMCAQGNDAIEKKHSRICDVFRITFDG
jgi:hypothetical protein